MSKKVSGWPLIAPRKLPEGLPAIEEGDAGKVLTAGEDGPEWAEPSGGGGGGVFILGLTGTAADPVFSMTADDVIAALDAGKMMVLDVDATMLYDGVSGMTVRAIPSVNIAEGDAYDITWLARDLSLGQQTPTPIGFWQVTFSLFVESEAPAEFDMLEIKSFTLQATYRT